MKFSIIVSFAFLFIGFKSLADCGGSGLSAYPHQKEIPKTSLFVLDGYAGSQQVIKNLNTEFPVYLQTGNERISLKVIEVHIGQFNISQALLKPEKPLVPGKKYQLIIENVSDGIVTRNKTADITRKIMTEYLVKDESDTEAPQWIKAPTEKDKSLEHFGCGPSIHVNFQMDVKEQSDFLVKTTVKNKTTGTETVYYIGTEKDGLSVGHGMCSGAFTFDSSIDYEAKFMLMDTSGNVSEETDWISFTRPVD